jgi:hypothetical protein
MMLFITVALSFLTFVNSQNPPCYICDGDADATISNPDGVVTLPFAFAAQFGLDTIPCLLLYNVGRSGLIPEASCLIDDPDADALQEFCGCSNFVAPTDAPVAVPVDTPVEVPVDTPTDPPVDVPVDTPTEPPVNVPVDVPFPPTGGMGMMMMMMMMNDNQMMMGMGIDDSGAIGMGNAMGMGVGVDDVGGMGTDEAGVMGIGMDDAPPMGPMGIMMFEDDDFAAMGLMGMEDAPPMQPMGMDDAIGGMGKGAALRHVRQ